MAKSNTEEVELEGLDDIEDLDLDDDDDLLVDDNEEGEAEDTPEPEPQPEKPKRGRPRGSGKKPEPAVKNEEPEEKPKKRRGRPPGSKNKPHKNPVAAATGTQVDPTNPVFLFRAALDNRIKDVKKAGGDVAQLEWVKTLADLLFA